MKTLGLDLGTTSICAVVFEKETGVLAAKTVQNAAFLPGERWERTQDAAAISKIAFSLVEELLKAFPDVSAIGVTGQMHGILYLDAEGRCLSPLYTWQDSRAALGFDETQSWAEHLSRLTGYGVCAGYGMATHYYNVNHGLVPKDAACFCTIADFLAMRLAGRTSPLLDASNAASFGLFDLQGGRFDEAALRKAGLDTALLPQVSKLAYLGTGSFQKPVYTAIGDNQAAFLGAVDKKDDSLLINVGTGSQVAVFTPVFLHVPGLETRPFPGGGYLLVGAALCGGRSYALLERFFRQTVQLAAGKTDSLYDAMERALDAAGEISDAPEAVTTFQGTRENPALRGSFQNISAENFTPVHFMHSVMNGMAQELYGMYRGFLDAGGKKPTQMIGSGNGLRKNRHLQRAFERVFSCPMELSRYEEEAACGAARWAEICRIREDL